MLFSLKSKVKHKQGECLKVKIFSLCSDQFVSVRKTFECTVEIQGCVSEIQFSYMQVGFLLIVGVFCTFTYGTHMSECKNPVRSPKHSWQINAYLWKMLSVNSHWIQSALHFSLCLINNRTDELSKRYVISVLILHSLLYVDLTKLLAMIAG